LVTNFEGDIDLGGLNRAVDGDHAKPIWKTMADGDNADSTVAASPAAGADAGSFALLIDPHAKGSDIDVKVRSRSCPAMSVRRSDLRSALRTATTMTSSVTTQDQ